MKNKIIFRLSLLFLLLTGISQKLLAQIQNPPIDGKPLTPAEAESMSHLVWYKEPWLWIVAILITVLVIVATRKIKVDQTTTHQHTHGHTLAD